MASVTLAPSVLSMHAQLGRLPAATVKEAKTGTPLTFVAQASLQPDDRLVRGSIQRARTRKGARQQAMASLLARLAGLPDPLADTALDTEDWSEAEHQEHLTAPEAAAPASRNPVSVLNEYVQAERIAKPAYTLTLTAPQLFTATVRCTHQGQTLQVEGQGPSKAAARTQAAEAMLTHLRNLAQQDEAPGPVEPEDEQPVAVPAPAAEPGPPPTAPETLTSAEPPLPDPASAADLFAATAMVDAAVRGGAAVTLLPSRHPAHTLMLLFDPSGEPLPTPAAGQLTCPLREMTRDLVLAGPGGTMPRRAAVTGWAVPLSLMLPALMATRDVPEHAAITGWRAAVRLSLQLVAQQRVHPGLTVDGRDCWRIGPVTDQLREAVAAVAAVLPPEAHCPLAGTNPVRVPAPATLIWMFLDAVADTMVRTPGAEMVIGPLPYAGRPAPERCREVWDWADAIEDAVDPPPGPRSDRAYQGT